MVVLDTSVIIKWFVEEKNSEKALIWRDKHIVGKEIILLPSLFLYEIANVLRYKTNLPIEEILEGRYIGSTRDLRKRILRHNSCKNKSTKYGAPWKLIYCEISLNKQDARARERYLKSGMGRKYLKNRLKFFFAKGF